MDSEKIQQTDYFEKKYNRGGRAFGGLVLVIIGVVWLIHRTHLVFLPTWLFTWPMFLIDDYVKIHTKDGSFLKKKTITYFENVMDASQFVRVHRSYIVQVQQVTRIEPYEKDGHIAILKSGEKIPISKTGYPKLKSILGL